MKTLRISIMAVCVMLAASAFAAEDKQGSNSWKIPSSKKNFHLFLLMGQSNMSGGVNIAAGDTQPVPHVLKMLHAREGDEPKWAPGAHPLHPVVPIRRSVTGRECLLHRLMWQTSLVSWSV